MGSHCADHVTALSASQQTSGLGIRVLSALVTLSYMSLLQLIVEINSQVALFRDLLIHVGQARDSPELREKIRKLRRTLVDACRHTSQLLLPQVRRSVQQCYERLPACLEQVRTLRFSFWVILQFLLAVPSPIHNCSLLRYRYFSTRLSACHSLVLGYRRPTGNLVLPDFPNCSHPTATGTLDLLCTH
jgi:hypothetical protein